MHRLDCPSVSAETLNPSTETLKLYTLKPCNRTNQALNKNQYPIERPKPLTLTPQTLKRKPQAL